MDEAKKRLLDISAEHFKDELFGLYPYQRDALTALEKCAGLEGRVVIVHRTQTVGKTEALRRVFKVDPGWFLVTINDGEIISQERVPAESIRLERHSSFIVDEAAVFPKVMLHKPTDPKIVAQERRRRLLGKKGRW